MTWRDELKEAVKSKAEREAEEAERKRKRVEAALKVAGEALILCSGGLEFALQELQGKQQPAQLSAAGDRRQLTLGEQSLVVELDRETAVLKVTLNDSKPREFDLAQDRHLAPKDIEEYVGRRAVELARAAYKAQPW